MIRVLPAPGARVYRIDTAGDLDALVRAYPLADRPLLWRSVPDWEAVAADGTDVLYVSARGLEANAGRYLGAEPSLHGWECASALWLSPRYRLTPNA